MLDYIKNFIQSVRVSDLIDIGVIAVFIYLILLWFKRARARFMFFGMVMVGSIYILARFFGLYLTTMVFQAFFAVAVVMIVIIFQDDLRHFFERVGIWGVPRRHYLTASSAQDVDILSSAMAELSRKKIGALVVVQGRDPLERHIEAGTSLDGLLSQVLLESIFDPRAPSHDGAVVVHRGRIAKFGCFLPLSTNVKEIVRLGTRHAAALGLSERSDALCLVVSEELGIMSVAEEGRMRQVKDIGELQSTMDNYYLRKFPAKRKITLTGFLTAHFSEKVIAVILACGLWFGFGHRTEIIRRDFVIPIEYRNLASNVIIKEPKPKEVTVTLSGSEQAFNLLNPKDLKLSLDMAEIKDGENEISLTKDKIGKPTGISVVDVVPHEIQFSVYRMLSLVIPVELKTRGQLPPDVVLRELKAAPKEISVTVHSTIPRDKLTISTEPIELNSITETTTIVPKLIVAPEIRFPDNKPPEIKVTIEVEKKEKIE